MRRLATCAVLAIVAALGMVSTAGAWTWPLQGGVLRPFAFGPDPYAGGQHRGIDVEGSAGEPVRAPASGTVTFAGSVPTHGRVVTILTGDGYAVTLAHLGQVSVAKGTVVAEGDAVGLAGSSGSAEHPVPYVHLGIRVSADEHGYRDPLAFLPARPTPSRPTPLPAPAPAPAPIASPAPATPSGPSPVTPAPAPVAPAAPVAVPPSAGSPVAAAPAAPTPAPARPPAASPAVTTVPAPQPTGDATVVAVDQGPAETRAPVPSGSTSGAASSVLDATVPPTALPVGSRHALPSPTPAAARREPDPVRLSAAPSGGPQRPTATPDSHGVARPRVATRPLANASQRTAPVVALAARPAIVHAPVGVYLGLAPPGPDARAAIESSLGAAPASTAIAASVPQRPDERALRSLALAGALALALLAALAVAVRRLGTIGSDGAVLPHDADLLRELDPAHRARVHDDRSRHPHPTPAAARA